MADVFIMLFKIFLTAYFWIMSHMAMIYLVISVSIKRTEMVCILSSSMAKILFRILFIY